MGNNLPRATVRVQEHHNGFRVTLPLWVADHLKAGKGTILKPSVWREGDRLVLDQDAVLLEVVEEDSNG